MSGGGELPFQPVHSPGTHCTTCSVPMLLAMSLSLYSFSPLDRGRLMRAAKTLCLRVPTSMHISLYRCKLIIHSELPLTNIYLHHEPVLIWSDISGCRDSWIICARSWARSSAICIVIKIVQSMVIQCSGPQFLLLNLLFEGQDCSWSLAFPKPPPQPPACTPRPLSDTDTAIRLKTPGTNLIGLDDTTGTAGQHVFRHNTKLTCNSWAYRIGPIQCLDIVLYSELESFPLHLM